MTESESARSRGAILTGAGGGIGTATAVQLAHDGYALALVDRDQQQLDRVADLVRAEVPTAELRTYVADVTDGAAVAHYVQSAGAELGPIRLLVNNAGIEGRVCAIHEYSEEEFDRVWAVNARGTWLNIKHVVPLLLADGGSIVNVASVAALRSSVLLAPMWRASTLSWVSPDRQPVIWRPTHSGERGLPGAGRYAHDEFVERATRAGYGRSRWSGGPRVAGASRAHGRAERDRLGCRFPGIPCRFLHHRQRNCG